MAQPRRGLADTALSVGVDISPRIQRLYAPPAAWSHGYLWGADTVTIPDGARFSPRTDEIRRPNRLKGSVRRQVEGYTLQVNSPTAVRALNGSCATASRRRSRPRVQRRPGRHRGVRHRQGDEAGARGRGARVRARLRSRVGQSGAAAVGASRSSACRGSPVLHRPRVDQSVWVLRQLGFDADPTTAMHEHGGDRSARRLRRALQHRRPTRPTTRPTRPRARGSPRSSRAAAATSAASSTARTSWPPAARSPASPRATRPATAAAASCSGTTPAARTASSPARARSRHRDRRPADLAQRRAGDIRRRRAPAGVRTSSPPGCGRPQLEHGARFGRDRARRTADTRGSPCSRTTRSTGRIPSASGRWSPPRRRQVPRPDGPARGWGRHGCGR